MPRPYYVTEYELQGTPRFDIVTHDFLTAEQARSLAHDILTAVTRAEAAQARHRPPGEGSTVGEVGA